MRILITGGSGFIGSHLAEHFQNKAEIRILDNLRTGHRKNLDGLAVNFVDGSILDRDLIRQAVAGCDYVFHLAAMVSVPESVGAPMECEDINARGLLNVLEEAAAAGVKKVFLASSAAAYGDNPTVPKVESMLPEPKSPYAITKVLGEYYCRFFHDEGRVRTACLRFFNVFGPRQDPRGPYAAAVPIFMEKAIASQPITIFGDGEQTRDFIYVKDIVSAIVHVTLSDEITGVFNAGYGGMITLNDLAKKILALSGSDSQIEYKPVRAGDVKHSRASSDLLRATGWTPQFGLDEGLRATMEYFRSIG